MAGVIAISSDQFGDDGPLPLRAAHPSVGGENRSPQLTWSGIPEGTVSLALTCWDPDAPTTVGFTHWVRTGMDPSLHALSEGSGTEKGPWVDGFTDWGESGWGGMAPPQGDEAHHYRFTVYALDIDGSGFDEHTTYAKFQFMIRGHVLAQGTITGRFAVA